MFKHLLLATDGSQASEHAIGRAMQFAKDANARVTGVSVSPEYHVFTYHIKRLAENKEVYAKDNREHAEQYLGFVGNAARQAGVQCDTMQLVNDDPYKVPAHG
jgi:nucleotide-binding universal stress UspA family protein